MMRTTRSATHDDAAYTPVNTSKPTSFCEALCRLKPGFDGVNGEEEQIYGGTGQTACLTANACPVLTNTRRK